MPVVGSPINSGNWPVTLDDVKAYLRIDDSTDDAVISSLLDFACEFIQRETQQQMLTATFTQYLDAFPMQELGVSFITGTMQEAISQREIRLPNVPLQSITSFQYLAGGVLTTVDPTIYAVDSANKPGRIVLNNNATWPVNADGVANAVKIVYVAGYGTAAAVPNLFKQAIKWLVGHCYENHEVQLGMRMRPEELPYGLRSVIESLMFREAVSA